MRRMVALTALAACMAVPAASADDCCAQGIARPWKEYNQGIKWAIGLSRAPERWENLKAEDFKVAPRSSLAERRKLFASAQPAKGPANWKDGLQAALDRGREENKPVLFFQLVGDLDLAGC